MNSPIDIYATGIPSEHGNLGYYNLLNWWDKEFTNSQKQYLVVKYKPMGGAGNLETGNIIESSTSVINFLVGLQSWFTNLSDENISEKILLKAESLITTSIPILDIHFLYSCFVEHYYKKRNIDPRFYDLAKLYCEKQIEISQKAKEMFLKEFPTSKLPRHMGFEQLAIILEKEKKYIEAIELCIKAKIMGWNTDWPKRITRIANKQSR